VRPQPSLVDRDRRRLTAPSAPHRPPGGSSTRTLGIAGERLAERFLTDRGYVVLARNWRSGRYELDLVMRLGEIVAFVEVKTRRPGVQDPAETLGFGQRRRIRRAAEAWIHAHPGIGREFRFDLVAVSLQPGAAPEISHFPEAFFGEDAR